MRTLEKSILVTGATGNVGRYVAKYLQENDADIVVAGNRVGELEERFPGARHVKLDFEDPATFDAALEHVDRVFLMRPPSNRGCRGVSTVHRCDEVAFDPARLLPLLDGCRTKPVPSPSQNREDDRRGWDPLCPHPTRVLHAKPHRRPRRGNPEG